MFRSCQIIIRELCSLLKLYYSIHNSIRICKRGVVAAYHVVWECVVEQWLSVRRTTLHIKCVNLKPKRKIFSATLSKHASACSSSADTPLIQIKFCVGGYNVSCAGNLVLFFRIFQHNLDGTHINAYQIFHKLSSYKHFLRRKIRDYFA